MRQDRTWMYKRKVDGNISLDFAKRVDEEFISYVTSRSDLIITTEENQLCIRCPCTKCHNRKFQEVETVRFHILENGFIPDYYQWDRHGEPYILNDEREHDEEEANPYVQMIHDVAGPLFDQSPMEEDPNPHAKQLYDALRAASSDLWVGCSSHSKLSATAQLLSIKADEYLSERCFDRIVQLIKSILPEENTLPENFRETKKLMASLGLPVEKIDCCIQGCMIYWGQDVELKSCKFCSQSRYKERRDDEQGYDVPYRRMFYFPITPRLQRLYASKATAAHMRWHAEHTQEAGVMTHCSDAEAWKHFDRSYPEFAYETRNVRLGLCTDGFQPFGQSGEQYSCWPIFMTPYNLPPWMCMRHEYIFITILVPGPKNPKQKIDVFLQPLIKELKELWVDGILTYDISMKNNFQMRAMLMWTVSDFPAYAMLSGWSTAGKLACPHCMESSDSFYLKHGQKVCWFDCHRKFLPNNHRFRRDKNAFLKDRIVKDLKPPQLSGSEILEQIDKLGLMKITEIGAEEHNGHFKEKTGWRKRSIFWDLPYWTTNLIRHNLDVMHIEKNVFDNIFSTVMDIEGRTKDNVKAREDIADLCNRPELEKNASTKKYPKASYCLDKEQKKNICAWLKTSVKFPDGYASNLARCVDMGKYKLFGMKTHDCHVFMQRLLHIAFRHYLPQSIWEVITELSIFFFKLTTKTITEDEMKSLEVSIPTLLCKLECIFPPSFFDSMEHLTIHLPYEAKIAGPVQYRWMYPFERMMKHLKKNATNKARVEGSICNAFLVQEAATFCSYYFEDEVYAKERRIPRNHWQTRHEARNDIDQSSTLPIFNHPGRASGKVQKVRIDQRDYDKAHGYVLQNCPEIRSYINMYINYMSRVYPNMSESDINKDLPSHFPKWFHELGRCRPDLIPNATIKAMAEGPLYTVKKYPIYFVNGYKFHTRSYGCTKSTMNWGVRISGSLGDSNICDDYYGMLEEIVELEYPGLPIKRIVLFKCDWFDNTPNVGTRVHPRYGIVEVKIARRWVGPDEPYVLASQSTQVCYISYPNASRAAMSWWVVCPIKSRPFIEIDDETINKEDAPYQADVDQNIALHPTNEEEFVIQDLSDPQSEHIEYGIDDGDQENSDELVDSDFFEEE